MADRPEFLTDEHLKYLDCLRESGTINMFGAGRHVEFAFELDKREAKAVLESSIAQISAVRPTPAMRSKAASVTATGPNSAWDVTTISLSA